MTKLNKRFVLVLAAAALLALAVVPGGAGASSTSPSVVSDHKHARLPIVIGHRGASGYRPEHTLAAYKLAIDMGADYIEPDLVSTKDHVLVARHENEIGGTTDVADHPEFADRRTTKTIDGNPVTGWFTEDFTLAELRTLRARERLPDLRPANTAFDGLYQVPTLQEVIDLSRRLSRELHRTIGIYPETKHPTYFRTIGIPLDEPLVKTLKRNELDGRRDKVFVQSFEVDNLKWLSKRIDSRLVQLLTGPADLEAIARYADAVGPPKSLIVPRDAAGNSLPPTTFVKDAHREGLLVHPYTFRNENQFLPLELRSSADPNAYGRAFAEYAQFFDLGVDGVFSDNPDTAVEAREA